VLASCFGTVAGSNIVVVYALVFLSCILARYLLASGAVLVSAVVGIFAGEGYRSYGEFSRFGGSRSSPVGPCRHLRRLLGCFAPAKDPRSCRTPLVVFRPPVVFALIDLRFLVFPSSFSMELFCSTSPLFCAPFLPYPHCYLAMHIIHCVLCSQTLYGLYYFFPQKFSTAEIFVPQKFSTDLSAVLSSKIFQGVFSLCCSPGCAVAPEC